MVTVAPGGRNELDLVAKIPELLEETAHEVQFVATVVGQIV